MEDIKISFEVLQRKHLPALVELYRSVFKKKVEASYFEIKYGLFRSDQEQMSVVGMHEGKVIGFFGAMQHDFQLEGQLYKMLYTCDYFLSDAYRGTGVFDQIYAFVKEIATERQYDYFYTFDSAQTHKFGRKMGWERTESFVGFDWIVFPKTMKSVLEKTLGSNWSKKRLEKYLLPYEAELHQDRLPESSLVYPADFLEMKQFNTHFFVELHGCLIWLKYDYRITIGFIDRQKEGDLNRMMHTLKSIARKSGVHQIVMHLRPEDPILEALSKQVKPFESYNASYLQLKDELQDFEQFTTHFVHGDMF